MLLTSEVYSSRKESIRIDLKRRVWISIYILRFYNTSHPRCIEILRVPREQFSLRKAEGKACVTDLIEMRSKLRLIEILDWSRVHDFIENCWTRPCREWNSRAQPECSLEIVTLNFRSRVSPTNDRGEPPPLQPACATRCNYLKRAAWPMKPWHLHITRLTAVLNIITILMTATSLPLIGLPLLVKKNDILIFSSFIMFSVYLPIAKTLHPRIDSSSFILDNSLVVWFAF
jgi:hypothetical protein